MQPKLLQNDEVWKSNFIEFYTETYIFGTVQHFMQYIL